MVFQSIRSHSEVDDGDLDTDLRQIMRIGELGGDEELEVIAIWYPVVTKSNHILTLLLDDVLL